MVIGILFSNRLLTPATAASTATYCRCLILSRQGKKITKLFLHTKKSNVFTFSQIIPFKLILPLCIHCYASKLIAAPAASYHVHRGLYQFHAYSFFYSVPDDLIPLAKDNPSRYKRLSKKTRHETHVISRWSTACSRATFGWTLSLIG